jgi:hypothetical protein
LKVLPRQPKWCGKRFVKLASEISFLSRQGSDRPALTIWRDVLPFFIR